MSEIVQIIESVGFPIAIIIFGAWYFLIPFRDAGLRFIATLETLLSVAGQEIHGLKATTAHIDEKMESTNKKVEVIGDRVNEISNTLGDMKKEQQQ
jgi:hypothetical protein